MKYKSWCYNVEPIASRLPDDCLKIVISYTYDDSAYNAICKFLKHHQSILIEQAINQVLRIRLYNSKRQLVYTLQKNNLSDVTLVHPRIHQQYT